jgi:CheY-like chemotaxis protein
MKSMSRKIAELNMFWLPSRPRWILPAPTRTGNDYNDNKKQPRYRTESTVNKQIGALLCEEGIITPDQLENALELNRVTGNRLASTCLEFNYADERSLAMTLSKQLGIPFVVLSQCAIPLELLATLPFDVASRLNCLPIFRDSNGLVVAMADPLDSHAVDEIRFLTGARIVEHGALNIPLTTIIKEAYELFQSCTETFFKGTDFDESLTLDRGGHVEIVSAHTEVIGLDETTSPPSLPSESISVQAPTSTTTVITKPKNDKTIVMIVDDDETLRTMLVKFISKQGYEVWEATDGRVALKLLQSGLPDAILLDAMLPGVHGFDICRRVKNAETTKHIPVIMISAVYKGQEHADKVRLHYGANAFFEKPLKLANLKETLNNCLVLDRPRTSFEELTTRLEGAINQSIAAEQEGDLATAANYLQEAIDVAPFYAAQHRKLSRLYVLLGETYRGIAQLEQAVELESDYNILYDLGMLYLKAGFRSKAHEAFRQSLLLCKDQQDAKKIQLQIQQISK